MKLLSIATIGTILNVAFLVVIVASLWYLIKVFDLKFCEEERVVKYYQYFEKDHLRNETSFGVVSLFKEIDTYVSSNDYAFRKEILISPFGTDEFECSGSCFCEEESTFSSSSSRRLSSHRKVLINGVSYLLAAVSSYVAFDLAEDYFSEKCVEEYSNICKSELVRSEVDKCEKVASRNAYSVRDDEDERRLYFCYGNCVERMARKGNSFRPLAAEKGIICTNLKKEAFIEVFFSEVTLKAPIMDTGSKMQVSAKHKFQKEYLLDFCKKMSRIEYVYNGKQKVKEKESYMRRMESVGYLCSSRTRKKGMSNYQNVKCRQIEPETKAYNRKWREKVFWEEKKVWDEM